MIKQHPLVIPRLKYMYSLTNLCINLHSIAGKWKVAFACVLVLIS